VTVFLPVLADWVLFDLDVAVSIVELVLSVSFPDHNLPVVAASNKAAILLLVLL